MKYLVKSTGPTCTPPIPILLASDRFPRDLSKRCLALKDTRDRLRGPLPKDVSQPRKFRSWGKMPRSRWQIKDDIDQNSYVQSKTLSFPHISLLLRLQQLHHRFSTVVQRSRHNCVLSILAHGYIEAGETT
jgi:hypothetical protein